MIDTKQMAKYIFEEYSNCYSEVDIEDLAKHLDEIKAEAIKEFAERLKKDFGHGVLGMDSVAAIIDSIVQEMVGDSNAE